MSYGKKPQDVLALSEHYIAIGDLKHYFHDEPIPWERVSEVRTGGLYRNGIPVSWDFVVWEGPMEFIFSMDIEPPSANGTAGYALDTAAIGEAVKKLPPDVARDWSSQMATYAAKRRRELEDNKEYIRQQRAMVEFVENMAAMLE